MAVVAAACAIGLGGCARMHDGVVDQPPDGSGGEALRQTAATSVAAPVTAGIGTAASGVADAAAEYVVGSSPVVTRLTRQGGAPAVRTSRWTPGNGPAAEGIAIQLVYRKDVRLVGVVPLVTPTGSTTYRVEKMRVDATARRFLVYVDFASGEPKVVGITAGE